jgi:hypothetical protein
MFIIAGHDVTYDDILGVDNWFQKYTMTVEQGDEFKKWGKKYLMKNLNRYAKQAEDEMVWFSLQWGNWHIVIGKSIIKTNKISRGLL